MNQALTIFALTITISATAFALEKSKQKLSFSNARIIVPIKGTDVTAGYVEIENKSDVSVDFNITDVKPFKVVELHETFDKEGKMGMRMIDKVTVAAHAKFELKPGGHHVMLFDAIRTLKVGEKIKVKFNENGKPFETTFTVEKRNGNSWMSDSHESSPK